MSEDFKLPSLDELFSTQEQREEEQLSKIREIALTDIDEFPNHPFKVLDNEDMQNLVDSIKEHGVITPATVRKKGDRYELVSGHRRKRACELADLETLRCEVVDIDNDEATVQMVDGNLQRSAILPSEKAYAYKMRLEAIKNSRQVGEACSVSKLSKDVKDSERQIQRYIRLTRLIKPLLDLVDENKIKLIPAVELSYLDERTQQGLLRKINELNKMPNGKQATELKDHFEQSFYLTDDKIEQILTGDSRHNGINVKNITKLIPDDVVDHEEYICKAIEFYNESKRR